MDTDKLAKLRAIADRASDDGGTFREGQLAMMRFTDTFNPSVVKAMLDVVEAGRVLAGDGVTDGEGMYLVESRFRETCRNALAALAEKIK